MPSHSRNYHIIFIKITYSLIFLLARYHPAYPSFRIGHIPFITGDEVHMYMKDRLPGSLIHIDAHIVSIRMIAFINFLLHILEHDIHGLPLMVCQIEIRSHMTLGDNQSMAGRYRITIIKGHTSSRFADDFHPAGQTAKRTRFTFFTRQFIKMNVLVKFIAGGTFQTQKRQTNIALISVLPMDGMKTEAFFLQITPHCKISRATWMKQVGDIHHYFGLSIRFKHIQHIIAEDGIEFPFRIIRTIIIVITYDIISLTFQLIRIKSKSATKIKNASFQQTMLKQITGRYGERRPPDSSQVRMVYFFGFHKIQNFQVVNPIFNAI